MKEFLILIVLLLAGYKISSTEAITVGDNCAGYGALGPYVPDRTRYYYCYDGKVLLGTCPAGYYYSIPTYTCVYGAVCSKDYTTTSYPGDTSKYYYCLGGSWHLVSCPIGTYYNAAYGDCRASSGGGVTCPPGAHITYATGCQTYVLCLNGVGYPQVCPSGQYYIPSTQACGYTAPSGCGGGGGGGAGSGGGAVAGTRCSKDQDLQAITGNCRQYLHCDKGYWVLQTCPGTYYYSAERKNCVPAASVKCP